MKEIWKMIRTGNVVKGIGAAVLTAGMVAGTAYAGPVGLTRQTVTAEEFTAEWCGPCVGGWQAMERMKDRWGDQVSLLTWSVSDNYTNPDGNRRMSEVGVTAIPSFLFQGTYFYVGTPSDQTIDAAITSSQNIARSGRIIGRWKLLANDVMKVGLKFQADQAITSNYELRICVWEDNWQVHCSNGLSYYDNHVQQVFYEPLPAMNPGQTFTLNKSYDLSGNQWIHDINNCGITVYLHDRTSNRSVKASWELGAANLGDLNGDLNITRQDGALFRHQMGKTTNDPGFNPAADWDSNGVINNADKQLFLSYVRDGGMR